MSAAFSRGDLLLRPACWKRTLQRGYSSAPAAPGLLTSRERSRAPCSVPGTSSPPGSPLPAFKSCSARKLTKSEPFTSAARQAVNKSPDYVHQSGDCYFLTSKTRTISSRSQRGPCVPISNTVLFKEADSVLQLMDSPFEKFQRSFTSH